MVELSYRRMSWGSTHVFIHRRGSDLPRFLGLHEQQLRMLGLPEALWRKLNEVSIIAADIFGIWVASNHFYIDATTNVSTIRRLLFCLLACSPACLHLPFDFDFDEGLCGQRLRRWKIPAAGAV